MVVGLLGDKLNSTMVFRTDSSLQIGTGHVMRCLTLADILAKNGANCHFICREHLGNLIERIRAKGFYVHVLPITTIEGQNIATDTSNTDHLDHSHWLGVLQYQDAQACTVVLEQLKPDWLIVDHYALDAEWEKALKPYCRKLMAIDDLADRAHQCDLLLDQTFGRDPIDYIQWVPSHCQLMCGSRYALLRPEFSELRAYSLQRRVDPVLQQVVVNLGGVDKNNMTTEVLKGLRSSALPQNCQVSVVMGSVAPWLSSVQRIAHEMPWPTRVLVNVENMAQLLADSDLAIGAAGSTSWERCCLGLPTVLVVLAENQKNIARMLNETGGFMTIPMSTNIEYYLPGLIAEIVERLPTKLKLMSERSSKISDGSGSVRVLSTMEGCNAIS